MTPTPTYTVVRVYKGHDGQARCYVKGHPRTLLVQGDVLEGDSVIIDGARAMRPAKGGAR